MIHQEKLKVMTQLALYEKKKGKKDIEIYSYQRNDYISFQITKTVIAVTIAFCVILGLIVLWNLEVFISHFDTFNYKQIGIAVLAAYLCILIFYLRITIYKSREEYNGVRPRVRRYIRGLKKMETFYKEEDQVQRKFEKGVKRDGK